MPLQVPCPHCQKPLKVAEHLAGKTIQCPHCKQKLPVPAPAPVAAPVEDDLLIHLADGTAPAPVFAPPSGGGAGPSASEVRFCPGCQRQWPLSAVLCTQCGYHFETGKKVNEKETWAQPVGVNKSSNLRRNLAVAVILILGVYMGWNSYNSKLVQEYIRGEAAAPAQPLSSMPSATPTAVPKEAPPAANSLLVVVNERFPRLDVFANKKKVGQAAKGQTLKISMEASGVKKPPQVSFEAKGLALGVSLDKETVAFLDSGLPFQGSAAEGLSIAFKGPPKDSVPDAQEVLKGYAPGDLKFDPATGTGSLKTLPYKGQLLKPADPKGVLRVGYDARSGKPVLAWVDQDCVIEKDGQVVYELPKRPFEAAPFKIVQKDGKPELAP